MTLHPSTHPASDAHHTSSSAFSSPLLARRGLLKGLLATAGVAAVPGLAGCSSSSSSGGSGASSSTVSFGSNAAVPEPKGAYQTLFAAAKKAQAEKK